MYPLHDALVARPRPDRDGAATAWGSGPGSLLRAVITGHPWIARWSSWLLGTRIHVSPVSNEWLRAHRQSWNKHRVDV